jgi:hypothetical protein
MNNATIILDGNLRAACAVNFIIGAGLKPDCTFRMTSNTGETMSLEMDGEALMRLAAALFSDPRFRFDRRRIRPDASLQAQTDAIFEQLRGG